MYAIYGVVGRRVKRMLRIRSSRVNRRRDTFIHAAECRSISVGRGSSETS